MAEYLASIFGTEKDKVNCSFYFKIGACRHGDRCSRLHNRPTFSQTIVLLNLYRNPQNTAQSADGSHLSLGIRPMKLILSLCQEVFTELEEKYGEIEEMNVCDNLGDHLVGNVYVKFRREEDAERAVGELNNRWFNGQAVRAELSPVTDFRESCCRQYEMGQVPTRYPGPVNPSGSMPPVQHQLPQGAPIADRHPLALCPPGSARVEGSATSCTCGRYPESCAGIYGQSRRRRFIHCKNLRAGRVSVPSEPFLNAWAAPPGVPPPPGRGYGGYVALLMLLLVLLAGTFALLVWMQRGLCPLIPQASSPMAKPHQLLPPQSADKTSGIIASPAGHAGLWGAPLQHLLDNVDVLEELIMLLDPEGKAGGGTRHLAARYGLSATWIDYAYSLRSTRSPLRATLETVAGPLPRWGSWPGCWLPWGARMPYRCWKGCRWGCELPAWTDAQTPPPPTTGRKQARTLFTLPSAL
ncbi:Splicing factor U2AF 26 kDa subunit [Chelonia mydas]|uniref:Splicing factor U2AF 26 kDa subunit n=1 Tax=Chelonia mydas TaxID=8469 RepID=M7B331_CHEMY|nr:Splicing factor U2AF 26 kDa subunit [Chelonia mydas]